MDYQKQIKDGRWQKKRLEIMQRDSFKCLACKSENNLHVHHLYYEKGHMIWEYDNESLVTLCESCHSIIHKDLAKISGMVAFKVLIKELDLNSKSISIKSIMQVKSILYK